MTVLAFGCCFIEFPLLICVVGFLVGLLTAILGQSGLRLPAPGLLALAGTAVLLYLGGIVLGRIRGRRIDF